MINGSVTSLREAANEFVNVLFYGTLMKEFREGQQNELFGNSTGSRIFQRQLDMELIRGMNAQQPSALAEALMQSLDPQKMHQRRVMERTGSQGTGNSPSLEGQDGTFRAAGSVDGAAEVGPR